MLSCSTGLSTPRQVCKSQLCIATLICCTDLLSFDCLLGHSVHDMQRHLALAAPNPSAVQPTSISSQAFRACGVQRWPWEARRWLADMGSFSQTMIQRHKCLPPVVGVDGVYEAQDCCPGSAHDTLSVAAMLVHDMGNIEMAQICAGQSPLVYTIYNEHYIPLPGCMGDSCELDEFLVRLSTLI